PIFANGETRVYDFQNGFNPAACFVFGSSLPTGVLGWYANITVTGMPSGPGFLTAYPDGTSRPAAATVNWASAFDQVNNSVIIPGSSPNGVFDLFASSSTHVIIDLQGIFISDLSARADQFLITSSGSAAIHGNATAGTSGTSGVLGTNGNISFANAFGFG